MLFKKKVIEKQKANYNSLVAKTSQVLKICEVWKLK